MNYKAISASKANHLYWLGRYTERVYLQLHILRRYFDKTIDDSPVDYEDYLKRMDDYTVYHCAEDFWAGYLYNGANPSSIRSGLTFANDNAIVLREEIKSETLSYIQMSLVHMDNEAGAGNPNITCLQPITDYLLAFWGSIFERVYDERVRNFLLVGKLVETLDTRVRFNYSFERINEAFDGLKACFSAEAGIFDTDVMTQLEALFTEEAYAPEDASFRQNALSCLNRLVLV